MPIPSKEFYEKGGKSKRSRTRIALSLLIVVALFLSSIYAIGALDLKQEATSFARDAEGLKSKIKNALIAFDTGALIGTFRETDTKIKDIDRKAEQYKIPQLSLLLENILPGIKELPGALENISLLSEQSVTLAEQLDFLKRNAAQFMFRQEGESLLAALTSVRDTMSAIDASHSNLKTHASGLKNLTEELELFYATLNAHFIGTSAQLYRAIDFTDGLIRALQSPDDQHLLLIFQNETEMRPSGGFIGSYGVLTLNQGNFEGLYVDDIYNADRQLSLQLIPPWQLQSVTKNWGARDANWFFDFPTSAKKVMYLLEESDAHSKEQIEFFGTIAINTNVLGSLLDAIGPITLPEYNLVLEKENFLKELQYEVEAGRDKKPGQNPKRVLSVLAPKIIERIQSLPEEKMQGIIATLAAHMDAKDIMFYFKDWKLQGLIDAIGAAGSVNALPGDFSGDYLAVINANIAGGKTDKFIDQYLQLTSEIRSDGRVHNVLTVTRTHQGAREEEWWYRTLNQNYIKILAPAESSILSAQGNDAPKTIPQWDYENYLRDLDLAMIETQERFIKEWNIWKGSEFGKSSFGTWMSAPPGATKKFEIAYQTGIPLALEDGMSYTFLFQKQSGIEGMLEYTLHAPPGYLWAESGNKTFTYEAQSTQEHVRITLTLRKI